MELIEGTSLANFIVSLSEKKQKIAEEEAWNIIVQICAALRYMHVEKRVIHRDIAPSNILIDHKHRVKLADFGLAKQWEQQSASMMKSFVGTIIYSCPEIVQSQPYTEKADIWSLGCILYELLTLTQPFNANNPLTVAKKIVDEDYEPVSDKEYSPLLAGIVKACMTADPKKRPNITQLLSMMTPKLVEQMDKLRTKEESLTDQLRIVGDRMSDMESKTNLQLNSPKHLKKSSFNPITETLKVNSAALKKMQDPISSMLEYIQKILLLTKLSTTLKKDSKQVLVESFLKKIFAKDKDGSYIKHEIHKLMNSSRDTVKLDVSNTLTYEKLNQILDDLERENILM